MKECSLCRRKFDKPLFQCWVLKEGRAGYGAMPNYKMVNGVKTLGLCFDCKEASTKFSEELLKESPHLKDEPLHYPMTLMDFDEEKELEKKWRELQIA